MLTMPGITIFVSTLASLSRLHRRVRALDQDISNPERDPPAGHQAGLVFVQEGEVLAVWTLYRLGRSLPRNLPTINELAATAGTSQP
jgi:hypothetical protein